MYSHRGLLVELEVTRTMEAGTRPGLGTGMYVKCGHQIQELEVKMPDDLATQAKVT